MTEAKQGVIMFTGSVAGVEPMQSSCTCEKPIFAPTDSIVLSRVDGVSKKAVPSSMDGAHDELNQAAGWVMDPVMPWSLGLMHWCRAVSWTSHRAWLLYNKTDKDLEDCCASDLQRHYVLDVVGTIGLSNRTSLDVNTFDPRDSICSCSCHSTALCSTLLY